MEFAQIFRFEGLQGCAQFCGCASDRNDVREVLVTKTNVSLRSVPPSKLESQSPAEVFNELEQLKAQQSTGGDLKQVQAKPVEVNDDSSSDNKSAVGGVGIVFQPIDANTLIVKGLRPDSQAAMSGLVQIGDRLIAVNDLQVTGISPKELACALLGPIGTKVILYFMRGRGVAQYPYSIEVARMQIRDTPCGPPPMLPPSRGAIPHGKLAVLRREALAPLSVNAQPRPYVSPPFAARSLSSSFR